MFPVRIRSIDMRLIDELFGMGDGYVLNFSNKTFAEFCDDELGISIYDDRYEAEGNSKAKRLRYFLKTSDSTLTVRTLSALWEYREADRRINRIEETLPNAEDEFHSLIERLGGTTPRVNENASESRSATQIDPALSLDLINKLMAVNQLEPQARGYAFERFLKYLFDANQLSARASFRLVGEQIDGSFELSADTYLLEAKWTSALVGVADLRSFNGKVEDKADWSRGLYVSNSGFSPEGLQAFGRAKRFVCMDGLDICEMLERNLSFAEVMAKKVRRAAESGDPFVRVRDLYP